MTADIRLAPYPSDLEAKGWSLDIDYERVEQSDTWAIATAEQRPWLLMLWMVSWRQVPVASFPNDHRLIAARLGMPVEQLTRWADVLMSGWELADDGRLYHRTLTQHVLRMADKRLKDRARVAAFRAKSCASASVVDASNALPTHDQCVSSTPTPTPTPTKEQEKTPRKRAAAPECPADVDSQVWSDWIALRTKKRAPVTATAIDGARSEAGKADMSLEAFLRVWCRRGSQGLEAEWIRPNERGSGQAPAETSFTRDRKAQGVAWMGSVAPRKHDSEIIDMEESNGPRCALG